MADVLKAQLDVINAASKRCQASAGHYDGKGDATQWIKGARRICQVLLRSKMEPPDIMEALATCLTGEARDWFVDAEATEGLDTGEKLLDAIATRFSVETTKFQWLCKHKALHQTGPNLEAYISIFEASMQRAGLNTQAEVANNMERNNIYDFIMSLQDEKLRRHLLVEEPETIKKTFEAALKKNNSNRMTNPRSTDRQHFKSAAPASAAPATPKADPRRPSTRHDGKAPWCRTCLAASRDHRHDYKTCPYNKTIVSTVTTAAAAQEPDANEILKSLNDAIYAGQNQASKAHNVVNN